MAIGDNNDTFARLKAALPQRWFGSTSDSMPVVDSMLAAVSTALSFIYSLYAYAALQTRIKSATDGWLDAISADFFGSGLPRKPNQSDTSFRANIIANLFRERATRNAVTKVLTDLTGHPPKIIEPSRPQDCGAYNAPNSGYGVAGAYGNVALTYQAFVIAYRPSGTGIPNIAGYGNYPAGYSIPSQSEYTSAAMTTNAVTDADIYAAIESVRPAATIVWVQIQDWPQGPYGELDVDFILNTSILA
ncbi:hypothetical protein [Burkholderia cepacia]|uniref:hypothetical protein n=1 Tax=Burkholderia cepacia TaxID=292 RepID=UPI00075E579B|nr:hypothetical protein [Burkholderia cepacia]KWF90404.1 hypothetical protein WL95_27645 [Burkholderia cepacia]